MGYERPLPGLEIKHTPSVFPLNFEGVNSP